MANTNVVKGAFLVVVALFFGVQAYQLPFGSLGAAGPGLFPLLVSGLVLLIAFAVVLRSRFLAPEPLDFRFKNIAIVAVSIVLFAVFSEHVNMLAGVFALVLVSAMASEKYHLLRNLTVAGCLALVALLMQLGLGFQLPLF